MPFVFCVVVVVVERSSVAGDVEVIVVSVVEVVVSSDCVDVFVKIVAVVVVVHGWGVHDLFQS